MKLEAERGPAGLQFNQIECRGGSFLVHCGGLSIIYVAIDRDHSYANFSLMLWHQVGAFTGTRDNANLRTAEAQGKKPAPIGGVGE